METVTFKTIPNSIYEISESGIVRNQITKKVLKQREDRSGGLVIRVKIKNKNTSISVARLLYQVFVNPKIKKGFVFHLNGCKTDNRLENLSFSKNTANTTNAIKSNTGELSKNSKLSNEQVLLIRQLSKEGASLKDLAETFNMSTAQICAIKNRRRWKHI